MPIGETANCSFSVLFSPVPLFPVREHWENENTGNTENTSNGEHSKWTLPQVPSVILVTSVLISTTPNTNSYVTVEKSGRYLVPVRKFKVRPDASMRVFSRGARAVLHSVLRGCMIQPLSVWRVMLPGVNEFNVSRY